MILGLFFLIALIVWPPPIRAHLRVYRYDVSPPQNGNAPYFNIYVRNDGDMDGDMKVGGSIFYVSGPMPESKKRGEFEDKAFDAMLKKEPWKDAPTLQAPFKAETYSSPVFPNADPDTAKKLQTGDILALLTGRIVSADKAGEHHTDYCLMVQKYQRPFFMCQRHNEAP